MSTPQRRAFFMLLGAVSLATPPGGGPCAPYTRAPNTAASLVLSTTPITFAPNTAATITLCREIQP